MLARSLRAGRCVLANRCSCSKYTTVQERRQFPPAVGGHRAGLSGRAGSRLRAWARGCTGQRPREPESSGEHLSSTEWPFLVRPPPRSGRSPQPHEPSENWLTSINTRVLQVDRSGGQGHSGSTSSANRLGHREPLCLTGGSKDTSRGRSSWGGGAVRAQADSSFCPCALHWALGGGGTASCKATTLKTLTSRQGDVSAGHWARRVREPVPGPDGRRGLHTVRMSAQESREVGR